MNTSLPLLHNTIIKVTAIRRGFALRLIALILKEENMKIKSYDRVKRFLYFDIDGEEYSARLVNGMIDEIERAAIATHGKSLFDLWSNSQTPACSILKKTFCIGLMKDKKAVKGLAAEQLWNKAFDKAGIPGMAQFYYVIMATVHAFGEEASVSILKEANLFVDEEPAVEDHEEAEKNA